MRVRRGSKDSRGRREVEVRPETVALRVRREIQDQRVHRELWDRPDLRDHRASRESKDQSDPLDLRVDSYVQRGLLRANLP